MIGSVTKTEEEENGNLRTGTYDRIAKHPLFCTKAFKVVTFLSPAPNTVSMRVTDALYLSARNIEKQNIIKHGVCAGNLQKIINFEFSEKYALHTSHTGTIYFQLREGFGDIIK